MSIIFPQGVNPTNQTRKIISDQETLTKYERKFHPARIKAFQDYVGPGLDSANEKPENFDFGSKRKEVLELGRVNISRIHLEPQELLTIEASEANDERLVAYSEFDDRTGFWRITGIPPEYNIYEHDKSFLETLNKKNPFFNRALIRTSYKKASEAFEAILNRLCIRNLYPSATEA